MSKNTGNIKLNFRFHIALKLFTVIGTLLFVAPSYASDLCQDGKKQLRGNYEVMQSDGGLWALMERSESLKDQSTLGFQIDNKLMRMVVGFETLCGNGSQKKPDTGLYAQIEKRLDRGKSFIRTNFEKISSEQFLNNMQTFKLDLDKFINDFNL